jgi:hypothetical protein
MTDLNAKVKDYWTARGKSASDGLAILDECIHQLAKRNWDPVSRFLSLSGTEKPKLARVVRAVFGDAVQYKVDKDHITGGKVTLKFQGDWDLEGSNSYAVIRGAVERGTAFNNPDFQKKLKELTGESNEKVKEYLEQLETTLKYLERRVKDVPAMAALLNDTIANTKKVIAVQKAKQEPDF